MSVEWYTPSCVIEAARKTMGGIDLDPASCEEANLTVKASRFFSSDEDGLLEPWWGRVWLNPPFGAMSNRKFTGRLVSMFESGDISQACCLMAFTPNSMAVKGMFGRFPHCHPRGKLNFIRPGQIRGQIQFPTPIFYLGPRVDRFCDEFSRIGVICGPLREYEPQARLLAGSD